MSSIGRSPRALQPRDRGGRRRRTVSATASGTAHGAVPGDEDDGAPGGLARARRRPAGRGSISPSARRGGRRGPRGRRRRPRTPSPCRPRNAPTGGGRRAPAGRAGPRRSRGPPGARCAASTAAAVRSTSSASSPGAATTSTSAIRPSVTVPVLSSTTVSTRRALSSTCGPRIRTPSCAPRPVPTSSAVGVASPSAHGQAMISTATPAVNALGRRAGRRQPGDQGEQPRARARRARTRRRRRRPAAAPAPGRSAPRAPAGAIRASWVCCPTRVARTTRRP